MKWSLSLSEFVEDNHSYINIETFIRWKSRKYLLIFSRLLMNTSLLASFKKVNKQNKTNLIWFKNCFEDRIHSLYQHFGKETWVDYAHETGENDFQTLQQ